MSSSEILDAGNKKKIREYFIQFGERMAVERESSICNPRLSDSYVYYLDRGIAGLTALTDNGEEKGVLFFPQNRLVGFTPMLMRRFRGCRSEVPEPFGIDTKTDCVFYRMDERTFNRLMDEDRFFMVCILEIVTCNYVDLIHKYHAVQGDSAKKRFCRFLLEFSVKTEEGRRMPKVFTYVEIAKYLGVHPVTLSKIAAELRERGIISKGRREIEILDAGRLETLAAVEK